jgi:hypothetical protein
MWQPGGAVPVVIGHLCSTAIILTPWLPAKECRYQSVSIQSMYSLLISFFLAYSKVRYLSIRCITKLQVSDSLPASIHRDTIRIVSYMFMFELPPSTAEYEPDQNLMSNIRIQTFSESTHSHFRAPVSVKLLILTALATNLAGILASPLPLYHVHDSSSSTESLDPKTITGALGEPVTSSSGWFNYASSFHTSSNPGRPVLHKRTSSDNSYSDGPSKAVTLARLDQIIEAENSRALADTEFKDSAVILSHVREPDEEIQEDDRVQVHSRGRLGQSLQDLVTQGFAEGKSVVPVMLTVVPPHPKPVVHKEMPVYVCPYL